VSAFTTTSITFGDETLSMLGQVSNGIDEVRILCCIAQDFFDKEAAANLMAWLRKRMFNCQNVAL
jgi:hypothetical protein